MTGPLNIVILGLSITSSWGNGHATVYRSLVRALTRRGHPVLFLERDVPWYADNRDLPTPPFGRTELYTSLEDLKERFGPVVEHADVVIVGSFVPDGAAVGQWVCDTAAGVTAFYDIDTPITLDKLAAGDHEYLTPELVGRYQLYLSFTGGPVLAALEQDYHAPMARPLYCCFDPESYYPEAVTPIWDLGYMGTYSDDRQVRLQSLMLDAANPWPQGRFAVAGSKYPETIDWPVNVRRIEHLPPAQHAWFYNRQRFTLNLTRDAMIAAGHSPSVRLFEAAACGTPIISDPWTGLDEFFDLGSEILIAENAEDTLRHLRDMPDSQRVAIGLRARQRVLTHHTAAHRAKELEQYIQDLVEERHTQRLRPTRVAPRRSKRVSRRTDTASILQSVRELGPWFHNLHLPGNIQTAPEHPLGDFPRCKWEQLAAHIPADLAGWHVLDVGCNAGFYSFELARRGAHVTAIDADPTYLDQARWAADQLELDHLIDLRQMQVYDLARVQQTFDLVLFMGVFYHLRYPLLGLDIVAGKAQRMLIFQTLTMPGEQVQEVTDQDIQDRSVMLQPGWPKMAFIEHRLAGDPTNWWVPNHAAVEAMLRSVGMQVIHRPGHELYLCQPNPSRPAVTHTWDSAELLSATGQAAAAEREPARPLQWAGGTAAS